MLAQSFQSAADLGITEPQKEALMKTLVLLETGKLNHVTLEGLEADHRRERSFSGEFNMAEWSYSHRCGTACCIGGTAEIISGVTFGDDQPKLLSLFYPQGIRPLSYHDITPAQAATALRSYLTTGNANWAEAVL